MHKNINYMAIIFNDIKTEDIDYNNIQHFNEGNVEYEEKNMSCHFESDCNSEDDDNGIKHFADD